jgi:Tol biopolymer transport system component
MAFQSSESGREEVYVQSFPPSGRKWQVSTAGGEEPRWRGDGRELFYIAGKKLMVVDVKTDAQDFQSGTPRALFEVRLEVERHRSRYQVASNGQRFLVNVPLESTLSAPITVVTNWTAGLKR